MKEKSAGAVIFRENKQRKYLLLHYEAGHWDFPKGNIEQKEEEKQTVIREIREETGITKITFIKGFKERLHYSYKRDNQLIFKEVIFYLAERLSSLRGKTNLEEMRGKSEHFDTKEKTIILSFEHIGYKWLNYDNALKQLTYKNAKELLKKAEKFLNSSLRNFL